MKSKSNAELYPEAWSFYIDQARNIKEEYDINYLGNYRIPEPNRSGKFIYAQTVEELWGKFIDKWNEPDLNSESIRSKIQYIVNTF